MKFPMVAVGPYYHCSSSQEPALGWEGKYIDHVQNPRGILKLSIGLRLSEIHLLVDT